MVRARPPATIAVFDFQFEGRLHHPPAAGTNRSQSIEERCRQYAGEV